MECWQQVVQWWHYVVGLNNAQWTAIATWVGSFGTVGTLIYAVKSANTARRETNALQRRQSDDDRREQATRVCAWIHGDVVINNDVVIVFSNGSSEPVFGVVLYLVWVQGAAYGTGEAAESLGLEMHRIRAIVQSVPPGQSRVDLPGPDNSPMQGQLGVEIAFTDAAGLHWVRRSSGALVSLQTAAVDHYGVSRPMQYAHLSRWPPSMGVI